MSDHLYWRGGIQVPPIDELVESLRRKFKDQEEELARVKKENGQLKSEHYKDEELLKLKEENSSLKKRLFRGFEITKEEDEKITDWAFNHDCLRPTLKYEFTPTGIGIIGVVKCSCGKKLIFRDLNQNGYKEQNQGSY